MAANFIQVNISAWLQYPLPGFPYIMTLIVGMLQNNFFSKKCLLSDFSSYPLMAICEKPVMCWKNNLRLSY